MVIMGTENIGSPRGLIMPENTDLSHQITQAVLGKLGLRSVSLTFKSETSDVNEPQYGKKCVIGGIYMYKW